MKVEINGLVISEGEKGEVTVTAKSGFAIRISPTATGTSSGFHVVGTKPGDQMQTWTYGKRPVCRGKVTHVTVYQVEPKVKA